MENQLSSWKVSSEGSKTVVVLRLTALTSMAEHNTHTVQQYRRKPPSQQNRDKKRAEEHSKRFSQQKERQMDGLKNQQASDFIDFGFELFKKTPEPCAHEHEYRDVHNTSQHEVFPRVLTCMKQLLVCLHVQHSETRTRTHSYTVVNINTA